MMVKALHIAVEAIAEEEKQWTENKKARGKSPRAFAIYTVAGLGKSFLLAPWNRDLNDFVSSSQSVCFRPSYCTLSLLRHRGWWRIKEMLWRLVSSEHFLFSLKISCVKFASKGDFDSIEIRKSLVLQDFSGFRNHSHSSLGLWFRVIKCTLNTHFVQVIHVFRAVHRFLTNFVAVL